MPLLSEVNMVGDLLVNTEARFSFCTSGVEVNQNEET